MPIHYSLCEGFACARSQSRYILFLDDDVQVGGAQPPISLIGHPPLISPRMVHTLFIHTQ